MKMNKEEQALRYKKWQDLLDDQEASGLTVTVW
jgi:hypothetical protein